MFEATIYLKGALLHLVLSSTDNDSYGNNHPTGGDSGCGDCNRSGLRNECTLYPKATTLANQALIANVVLVCLFSMGTSVRRPHETVFHGEQSHCTYRSNPTIKFLRLKPGKGTAGNVGMYASGIPLGYLVDTKGPRPGTFIGTVALFVGYFPIHRG